MDLCYILNTLCPNSSFVIRGENYSDIDWDPINSSSLPTLTECEEAWNNYIKTTLILQLLREERDKLLNNTDKYLTSDFVYSNGVTKQDWLIYRQALRDLPTTASPQLDVNGELTNVTWPTPPS